MVWNAYIHPQKASLSYSKPPQPPLASRLCVGAETSHRREQKGVQLPSPNLEVERFNEALSTQLRAPSRGDGE